MVLVAEVIAVASAPPASPRGRVAAAGPFRVFVEDEIVFVALSRTGCFFGHPKAPGVNIRGHLIQRCFLPQAQVSTVQQLADRLDFEFDGKE